MNWPIKKLGEVADYINGRAFKPTEWGDIGLPIIRIQNLTETQEKFNYFDGKLEDRYLVKNGDILLSWSASLGVYIWDKGDAALNQHIFKVIPHKDINKSYLFYSLIVAVEELKRRVHGSTMTHVTKPVFNRVTTSVPSLATQKQIVERMDKIVEARKLNDDLIQKSAELFQSLLHKELNPVGKNWGIKKLGEVCEIARGGSPRPINKYLTNSPDGINWIKIGDVKEGEMYVISTKQKIKPEGVTKTRLVKEGDFILSNSMSFGRPYIMKIAGAIHDGWLLLRLKNTYISADFLYYILISSQTQIQFEKAASGGVVRNLNSDLVRKVKISLPPLATQKQIVAKLSAVREYKKQLLEQKTKLKELFDSVLHKSLNEEMN